LATDYCVKATARDALAEGFRVTVVPEACRAVNMAPSDGDKALEELRDSGCAVKAAAKGVGDVAATGAVDVGLGALLDLF
jgi:nicotinamidase/pyrazinamidase